MCNELDKSFQQEEGIGFCPVYVVHYHNQQFGNFKSTVYNVVSLMLFTN